MKMSKLNRNKNINVTDKPVQFITIVLYMFLQEIKPVSYHLTPLASAPSPS